MSPIVPVAGGKLLDQVVVRGALLFEADPALEHREVLPEQFNRAHPWGGFHVMSS